MKKLLKLVSYIVLGVIGLLVLTAVALKFIIDPNDYREQISAQASKAAGREINIEGDLSLSVFPWLGIELGRVTVGNPAGFSGQFASIDNAGAALKLLPLLGKNIEINRILLDGLQANLQVNSNGVDNWSGLGQSTAVENETETTSSGVNSLSIAAIDISNGSVSLNNAQSGQHIEISDFNLNAQGIASAKPFSISSQLQISIPAEDIQSQLSANGDILFNQATGQVDMQQMQLSIVDQSAQALPALNFTFSGDLNTQTELLNLPELELSIDDINLTGQVNGRNVMTAAELNGQFQLAEFSPKSVAEAFGASLPALSDDQVMQRFSGELQLAITPELIQISELQAKLDDSTLNGDFSIALGDRPNYRFDLNVDQINLDRYLPASSTTTVDTNDTVSQIPVETFRSIDANGNFTLGSVVINNLNARNISVQMQADHNGWRFAPLSADFYEGRFNGSIAIDATGNSPVLRADDNLNQVVAQAMLADMLGTDVLDGLALFDADINADLNQPIETLTGEVSFDISDGSIEGVDIADLLRKGFNLANNLGSGLAASEEFLQGGGKTDFASLSGRFIANNGVIRNNDLQLLSPLLRVVGEGVVDLPNDNIDYRVTAELIQILQGEEQQTPENATGKKIPIHITGSLTDPKYSVDPRAILQILAGERLQQQKDQLLDKVGERLGGKDGVASGLLDNVLNNALGTKSNEQDQGTDNSDGDGGTDATEQDKPSVEEQVGGALLNGLFNRRKRDDDSDQDSDDDNNF